MKFLAAALLASVLAACSAATTLSPMPATALRPSAVASAPHTAVRIVNDSNEGVTVLTSARGCLGLNFSPWSTGSFLEQRADRKPKPGELPSGTAVSWTPNACELSNGVVILVGPVFKSDDCGVLVTYDESLDATFVPLFGDNVKCLLTEQGSGSAKLVRKVK